MLHSQMKERQCWVIVDESAPRSIKGEGEVERLVLSVDPLLSSVLSAPAPPSPNAKKGNRGKKNKGTTVEVPAQPPEDAGALRPVGVPGSGPKPQSRKEKRKSKKAGPAEAAASGAAPTTSDTGSTSAQATTSTTGKPSSPLLGTGQLPLEKAVPTTFKGNLAPTHDVLVTVAHQCTEEVKGKFKKWRQSLEIYPETPLPVENGMTNEVSTNFIVGLAGFMGPHGPEDTTGADALHAFEVALEGLKIYAILQMKVEKFELRKNGVPNLEEPTVDWTYESGSAKNLQMNLIQKEVEKQRAEANVHVLGGYIVFSLKGIKFVPIENVIEEYNKHKTDLDANKEDGKRKMTKVLMGDETELNFIDAIIKRADPTFHVRKGVAGTSIG
ncbi:hypothetical protein FRC17_001358 [Serendipita sp. 399]|nr:hypothetical protein FRC17_001358 [Serendipita sp. 399]